MIKNINLYLNLLLNKKTTYIGIKTIKDYKMGKVIGSASQASKSTTLVSKSESIAISNSSGKV